MEDFLMPLSDSPHARMAIAWGIALATSLMVALLARVFLLALSRRLRKLAGRSASKWGGVGLDLLDGLRWWVIALWALFVLSRSVAAMGPFAQKLLLVPVVAGTSYQVAIWGLHVILSWRTNVLDRRVLTDPSSSAAIGLLYKGVQAAFLSLVFLISLSNLGVDISALVAGLGVGGIAVALAAQNVLGDLLASLSIVLDKPFVVGDFIVLGTSMGTVEHIGIKTTRLRSLSGEQLVLSNKDLLESRIQNFKRMHERRVVQKFGVVYSTPAESLESVPTWVRQIVEGKPRLRFDRCHFAAFGESSLDFELVFHVLDPDYNVFMDLQQQVLLELLRVFKGNGVDFAFPTRTILVEGPGTAPDRGGR